MTRYEAHNLAGRLNGIFRGEYRFKSQKIGNSWFVYPY